jgi:hypothetical protein
VTATSTGPAGLAYTVSYKQAGVEVSPISAGSYAVVATLSDVNYSGTATGTLTIAKAAVTAKAGSGSTTYDGATHAPSACEVTGVYTGTLSCANSPASVGPDVGTTVIEPVVSGDTLTNFDITSTKGSYTINQAPSATVVTCTGTPVYNGAPHTPCTVAVTGAGGLSLTPTPVYSNNINAGLNTASASYTFAGDTNHTGSNARQTSRSGKRRDGESGQRLDDL